jgi:hypothetical protein
MMARGRSGDQILDYTRTKLVHCGDSVALMTAVEDRNITLQQRDSYKITD